LQEKRDINKLPKVPKLNRSLEPYCRAHRKLAYGTFKEKGLGGQTTRWPNWGITWGIGKLSTDEGGKLLMGPLSGINLEGLLVLETAPFPGNWSGLVGEPGQKTHSMPADGWDSSYVSRTELKEKRPRRRCRKFGEKLSADGNNSVRRSLDY